MKTHVAMIDRFERRLIPQTPWPLVQPLPSVVPIPTASPATITRTGEIDREADDAGLGMREEQDDAAREQTGEERDAPRGRPVVAVNSRRRACGEQPPEDAADPRDASREEQEE